jgi:hypothetical protein
MECGIGRGEANTRGPWWHGQVGFLLAGWTVYYDGAVKVWDAASGELKQGQAILASSPAKDPGDYRGQVDEGRKRYRGYGLSADKEWATRNGLRGMSTTFSGFQPNTALRQPRGRTNHRQLRHWLCHCLRCRLLQALLSAVAQVESSLSGFRNSPLYGDHGLCLGANS